jgi:putative ABC transport system permease protein
MARMWSDLRHAIRALARQPAFTATALLTLALGIGATTAIFSVVRGVLLRPLPYANPEELVQLSEEHPGGTRVMNVPWLSNVTADAWRRTATTLQAMATHSDGMATVGDTYPERLRDAVVSPSLFPLLRVTPGAGRFFVDEDAAEGAAPVVVLSEGFWRDRYGASPEAMGQRLVVNGVPHEIVGVAPRGFAFPERGIVLWRPEVARTIDPASGRVSVVSAIGRLAPGITPAQAAAEGTAAARSFTRPPATELLFGKGGPVVVHARPLLDELTGRVRPALLVLAAAVGVVLLIACANVANLFLSRGIARQRELSVRAALGAGRGRLVRQLLTESLALALAGGVLGMGLASGLTRLLPAVAPADFPRLDDVRLDTTVMAFAVAASIAAGVLAGVMPALRGSRQGLVGSLQDGDRRSTGVSGRRLGRALLVAEAAMAVMLLVGAALLGRSFATLMAVDAGYDPDGAVTAGVLLPGYLEGKADTEPFVKALLPRLEAVPGVVAAGAGNMAPLAPVSAVQGILLPELQRDGDKVYARALSWAVTPGYAEALGLRLRQGRLLAPSDVGAPTQAFMVNEEFVRLYYADGKPVVGRRYPGLFNAKGLVAELVGVVGSVRKDGLDGAVQPEVYVPAFTADRRLSGQLMIAVRTTGDPDALVPELRRLVAEVDPRAALDRAATLRSLVATSVAAPRFSMAVLGGFSMVAALLAGIGLYGVLAYGVSLRRREMGVRAAMGARRGQLVSLVVREGLAVAGVGLALGLGAAAGLSGLLESLLFGVTPLDAWAYVVPPVVMLAVAVLACVVPARRAASVDPAEVLRCE